MTASLQPLLHDRVVALSAPAQVWSAQNGTLGSAPIDGIYVSDVRVVSESRTTVAGRPGEHIATASPSARVLEFLALHRGIDNPDPDPDTRSILRRTVNPHGVAERLVVTSRLDEPVDIPIVIELRPDATPLERVKAGLRADRTPEARLTPSGATWSGEGVSAELRAPGAAVRSGADGALRLEWQLQIPARGTAEVEWSLSAKDAEAVVTAPSHPQPWHVPAVAAGDERLERWIRRALEDLDALRLETVAQPGDQFLAAGAPWFFTLFGRDSIWAARFLLPLGPELAAGTLRVLAGLQGRTETVETAEQPGKIMHELRRAQLDIPGDISLPPLYYGTVDATPLWICLLHDAWRWGMPDDEVRPLLPTLRAALAWMRDYGDSDGDGLLEYVDATGHGLSNQGWKDSGDSVQWQDGSLADGPIALCEVQAYAYEAATHGADLLEHFGEPGDEWRAWALTLKARFDASFWIDDPGGPYPAIALDARKRPVDTVTSNLGHLLGTGLLDARQSGLVARRLASPDLDSGYGLRTMSTTSAGYWPLSYHGGSVWTHDTAIAILGLAREGHRDVADALSRGLLAAVSGFDYRVPELHSGDSIDDIGSPVPYPAACRPQAWSAAAAVAVLTAALGLEPGAGGLGVSPSSLGRNLSVNGLRYHGETVALRTNNDAEILSSEGVPILVG
ncbi:glycogen debranching N-terminal domain-containing protein [Lysobacter korlensis]|uniref:Glycogen debranching N-terminal domain-containing protein n=1 Tax=Lysobacter korlensis TaxID=553636 RepID=A0ABV6RVH5_9GAMM